MSKNNQKIEILRFVSISMLILYHATLLVPLHSESFLIRMLFSIGHMGWIGTDIFLVIAGYLCFISINKRIEAGGSLWLYYKNRLLRIVPSYYLFLFIYINTGIPLINSLGKDFIFSEGFMPSLWLFISNYYFAFGKWSGVALEGMFSISMIFQLFLLWGTLIYIIKQDKNRVISIICFEILAIILRLFWNKSNYWGPYFFTFTRQDAFLAGMLLAIANKNKFSIILKRKLLIFTSSILLLCTIYITKGIAVEYSFTNLIIYPVLSLFGLSLVNLAVNSDSPQNVLLIQLSKLGEYSYSTYLWKLPMCYFVITVYKLFDLKDIVFLLFICYLSCLFSGIIWTKIINLIYTKVFQK